MFCKIFRRVGHLSTCNIPLICIHIEGGLLQLPITKMPIGGFEQSVIGLVNMSRVDSYGIPLPCLKHLLEDGLLSEDPRHRPACGLYEDQIYASDDDMYPCRECIRRDILRVEEGADTSH